MKFVSTTVTMTMSFRLLSSTMSLPAASAFRAAVVPATHRQARNIAMASTKAEAGREISMELMKLFNKQVTNELKASQLYLAASIWCDENELVGMAKYMRSESAEERQHAMGFVDFANKKKISLKLENVTSPPAIWESPQGLWEDILKAEMENTEALMKLGDAASECDDHAIATFLHPYHMEQVESEDELRTILAKVKDESKTPGLIRQLDNVLGEEAKD